MAGWDRVFTPGEVDELVPRLETAVRRLQMLARHLARERRGHGDDETAPPLEVLMRSSAPARALIEEIDALASEIEALGGQLKDLELGLVDFPATHEGERVLLCWQYGEPVVSFWHRPDEGFGGRKLLPGLRPGPTLQ